MPQFPHHAITLGSTGPAAPVANPGGGGYYTRKRRWLMACTILFLLIL